MVSSARLATAALVVGILTACDTLFVSHRGLAQTVPATPPATLPPITVVPPSTPPKPQAKPKAPEKETTAKAPAPTSTEATPQQAALDKGMQAMDASRENILPKLGASSYTIDRQAIETLPQGDNTPIDKVILQMPGVSYDSAVSNPNFHVRSEYANVQTRINGVVLPEGVSALGPVIDTNFVGSMSLLTGTLPAQYGLRTAGVLDITSRSFSVPSGSVSIYGGSNGTITESIDYGGSIGNTQYFITARGNSNDLGLENPTPSVNAIHDHTDQGKIFAYVSTLLNDSTRVTFMAGASASNYQIPNNPNQPPLGDFGSPTYSSTKLNEYEYDRYYFDIATLQTKGDGFDAQLSVFYRYAMINFVPDVYGDLVFNDVASNVTRASNLYGTQFDASYRLSDEHKLRMGFAVSAEETSDVNLLTVLPVNPITGVVSPTPFQVNEASSLLGWNIGTYIQDEWKLTDKLTLNTGIRFDQLYQYVDANQFSPRAALVYKPFDGTTIHVGYARYFTPPMQAQAAPTNLSLVTNTTNQPAVPLDNPVLPERSHYFDVGMEQKLLPGLTVGADTYYKIAKDQIDDGQFGQAVVLTQFNFARGYSEGAELKAKYQDGNFKAYANFAVNITRAMDVISNQYLIDAATYDYLLTHYHYTDDMQLMTGSAGVSYKWDKTLFTTSMIYGSGLRAGFANEDHCPEYVTVNLGIAHELEASADAKPLTVRFDIVNLFDQVYELREGSGIGVFAPQYGARRGFFAGLSQKF